MWTKKVKVIKKVQNTCSLWFSPDQSKTEEEKNGNPALPENSTPAPFGGGPRGENPFGGGPRGENSIPAPLPHLGSQLTSADSVKGKTRLKITSRLATHLLH